MIFAAVAWILVFAVIFFRAGMVVRAWYHMVHSPTLPAWRKVLLLDAPLWTRLFQFILDLVLTLLFGAVIRLMIAGTASAAVGAFVGLSISLGVQGSGGYGRRIKRKLNPSTA